TIFSLQQRMWGAPSPSSPEYCIARGARKHEIEPRLRAALPRLDSIQPPMRFGRVDGEIKARNAMADWEPMGFGKLMGFKLIQRSPERSEAELVMREELCNRRGVMHGGALMGWADTMGGLTATAALTEGQRTATI